MAEVIVEAVVLRRRDSGESDRRLTLLTREVGKIDVIAKGARKGGSRLAGSSDPLAMATMNLATGKKNLFVTQTQPLRSFRGLRTDFERLHFALALLELYSAVVPYEEPSIEAFELLVSGLAILEASPKPIIASIWAQLELLTFSGFLPSFGQSAVSGAPIAESHPYVSPHAGGYVTLAEAAQFTDRIATRAEVLYGLNALISRESPPANLRFSAETFLLLLSFWRHIVDTALPANEAAAEEIRLSQSRTTGDDPD